MSAPLPAVTCDQCHRRPDNCTCVEREDGTLAGFVALALVIGTVWLIAYSLDKAVACL